MPSESSQTSPITGGDEIVASNQPVNVSTQLPVEVYELVIDWINIPTGAGWVAELRELAKTLSTCSLVCRAWRIRAQAHLFKKVSLNYEGLSSLDIVLRNHHAICSMITEMHVVRRSMTQSISLFATRHRLSNLIYLNLDRLDLTREHRWLHRAPLFRSVLRLRLFQLQNCQLSPLILFVNSFPSITRLDIFLDFTELEHTGQILPKPFRNNTRSLKWLNVQLIPGSSRLIEWLFKAKSLSSQLTTLILLVNNVKDEVEFISSFNGIRELLHSCRNSIEDLRLHLTSGPMVESVSDILRLDSLRELRCITYGSANEDFVLPYAVRQLGTIATRKLVNVTFDIRLGSNKSNLDAGLCGSIDDLLSGGKFPSLENVFLHRSIAAILFPKLCNNGLLRTLRLEDSYWLRKKRLPNDLCERIIDYVYHGSVGSKWKWNGITTLIACSLVCPQWRYYSQAYLSKPIEVSYEDLTSFSEALVNDRRIGSGIKRLKVVKKSETIPISPFAIQHRLPNLKYLNIERLDLTREHRLLHKAPLFHSVRELKLYRLQSCQLSQLIRVINAFPSLLKLELNFAFNKSKNHDQILPRLRRYGTRALTWLQLSLKPGVSRLIDWFLVSEPFLAQLKKLVLCAMDIPDEEAFVLSFMGVGRLLDRCRNSVEDFRLHLDKVPTVECVSDLVELDSFPNLKYLTYGTAAKDVVLPYVIRQLGAITSKSNLTQIYFDLSLDHKNQPDEELCKKLDDLLTGGKFPSLQRVGLRRTIHPELFPRLNAAGRLWVPDWSFWLDPPVTTDEDARDALDEGNKENEVEGEESGGHIRDTVEEENDGPDTTTMDDENLPLALPESED